MTSEVTSQAGGNDLGLLPLVPRAAASHYTPSIRECEALFVHFGQRQAVERNYQIIKKKP